jgi:hypothetical protein
MFAKLSAEMEALTTAMRSKKQTASEQKLVKKQGLTWKSRTCFFKVRRETRRKHRPD